MVDPEGGGGQEGCPDPPFKNYFDEKSTKIVKASLFAKIYAEKKLFDKLLINMYFYFVGGQLIFYRTPSPFAKFWICAGLCRPIYNRRPA